MDAFNALTETTHPSAIQPAAGTSRSQQAWQRAQALLGGAVVGASALAAAPALAAVAAPAEPTLQFEGSRSGNHNSSGWFTSDSHSGSAGGRAFGTLDEGVKLYGHSSLAREQYKFNTWTTDPDSGWQYTRSDSTGLAMAWWGTASGLRADQTDPDSGELLQPGDTLAFNYEFSITGPSGTSWRLRGGFTDHLQLEGNSGLLQSGYLVSSDEYGGLQTDGTTSFSGALVTQRLYELPQGAPIYWLVTLYADLPYDPGMGLTLTVPQNSIDAGVNMAPVPEPGQWALLLAGLGAVAGVTRRRQPAGAQAH